VRGRRESCESTKECATTELTSAEGNVLRMGGTGAFGSTAGPTSKPSRLKRPGGEVRVNTKELCAANPNQSVESPVIFKPVDALSKTAELLLKVVILKPDSLYGELGLIPKMPPAGATFSKLSTTACAADAVSKRQGKAMDFVFISVPPLKVTHDLSSAKGDHQ